MKKSIVIGMVALAGFAASCTNSAPKADMSSDLDTLSYAIGMAQTQGLKDYLVQRVGVDTTYMDEFVKGLTEGATAGDDKKKAAYYAGVDYQHEELHGRFHCRCYWQGRSDVC